jgi:hypothetical protein
MNSPENKKTKLFQNTIIYPLSGLLCLVIGVVIITSGLNVHSGEIFLWLLGIFGFLFSFPAILFAKSIQILKRPEMQEKSKIRYYSIVLTTGLGLFWITIIAVGLWKEW